MNQKRDGPEYQKPKLKQVEDGNKLYLKYLGKVNSIANYKKRKREEEKRRRGEEEKRHDVNEDAVVVEEFLSSEGSEGLE